MFRSIIYLLLYYNKRRDDKQCAVNPAEQRTVSIKYQRWQVNVCGVRLREKPTK